MGRRSSDFRMRVFLCISVFVIRGKPIVHKFSFRVKVKQLRNFPKHYGRPKICSIDLKINILTTLSLFVL